MWSFLKIAPRQPLLPRAVRKKLLQNGVSRRESGTAKEDAFPIVKLQLPDVGCVWLLTELDPDRPDIAFGYCDMGMGWPELMEIEISEFDRLRSTEGRKVERVADFVATKSLAAYLEEGRVAGRPTSDQQTAANTK